MKKRNRLRLKPTTKIAPADVAIARSPAATHTLPVAAALPDNRPPPLARYEAAVVAILLNALFVWANWAGIESLVSAWDREPDYSHGYLVPPIALLFLWLRRDRFPGVHRVPGWGGLCLLAVSVVMLWAGRHYFLNPLVHWSLIAWIGGVVWVLAGWRVFWWALPAIGFLIFMVPLPYRMEGWLGWPLQRVATYMSTWTLQLLGQPAVAEGNTILLGATQLEIEQACSGLRMLVMITALAVACAMLVCRNWPERVFLAICILPVALIANTARIVSTGLAFQYLSDEASKAISHDIAGWIVVPVAAMTMGLALLYWRRLFVEVEQAPLTVERSPSSEERNLSRTINAELPAAPSTH